MTVTTEQAAPAAAMRDLLPADVFARVAARTATEHSMPADLADRSLTQTLLMLHAIAAHQGLTISPPRVIDVSWHMLILHSKVYIELCDRLSGHYLHHDPADGATDAGAAVRASAQRLRDLGYVIDEELWAMVKATNCHNSCSGCDNSVD